MYWIYPFYVLLEIICQISSKSANRFPSCQDIFPLQISADKKNSASLVIKLTVCSQSLQTKQTVYKIEKKLGKSQRDQNKSKKDLFS